MDPSNAQSPETIPFNELSTFEQITTIIGVIAGFALFAAFFYFIWWKMIRAYIQMPKELAGIRMTLERIANSLEKRNDQ